MLLLGDRGDPRRPWEHGWTVLTILTGAYFYAQLLGAITTAMGSIQASEAEYRGRMDMVCQYLKYRKVPTELRREVARFMAVRYPGQRSFNEQDILEQCASHLTPRTRQLTPCLEGGTSRLERGTSRLERAASYKDKESTER